MSRQGAVPSDSSRDGHQLSLTLRPRVDIPPGSDQILTRTPTEELRPLMLSVSQVCKALGLSRTTLWAMVRDGEIGSVKYGARLLFPLPVVEEYVAAQAGRAREQAEQRQRARSRRSPVK